MKSIQLIESNLADLTEMHRLLRSIFAVNVDQQTSFHQFLAGDIREGHLMFRERIAEKILIAGQLSNLNGLLFAIGKEFHFEGQLAQLKTFGNAGEGMKLNLKLRCLRVIKRKGHQDRRIDRFGREFFRLTNQIVTNRN